MAVTQKETDSKFADQIRSWYDNESYGAYKQVDPRTAAGARAQKIRHETIYHVGSRFHDGVPWADDEISSSNNFFRH